MKPDWEKKADAWIDSANRKRMRKIIQLLYHHTTKAHRPVFLALCDDGSVWRQVYVEVPAEKPPGAGIWPPEPFYVAQWERATEFDQLTNIQAFVQAGMINQQNPLNEETQQSTA